MALGIPVVWTDAHRSHEPEAETWVGMRTPATEVPSRAETIRATLADAGARIVDSEAYPAEAILAVHSAELVSFLRDAWPAWEEAGLPADPGQSEVVPYVFPHPGLLQDLPLREPVATWARPGAYCYDTMTPIGSGTWGAVRAAADAALTAADLVLGGEQATYACCRPPGHHVTRTAFGGSCYLNNSAIAAQRLRGRGVSRVAVLDVDAHHGNGAQAIFWERDDVFTGSLHVDPAHGWFPHYLGFADERGAGAGKGANLNVPVTPASGDGVWLSGVERLLEAAHAHASEALVVSLGVDAGASDSQAPLAVTEAGFRETGRRLGSLGVRTVFVQEGGYDLATLGALVRAVLEGFEETYDRRHA